MKKLLILASALLLFGSCTKEFDRKVKDTQSKFLGLNRTVKVYAQDGELIGKYEGKIDIEDNSYGNKVKFEIDGKRVIIYNAIVVVEEK